MKNNKKGNIQAGLMTLVVGVLLLVVVAFVLSSGSSLLGTQQSTITPVANCGLNSTGGTGGSIGYTACGYAYNASQNGLVGLNTMAAQQPSIGSIVVLAAIVVILFGIIGYFATK